MAFRDPRSPNWGCLLAGAFLLLVGAPAWMGWALGECVPEDGSCDDKPTEMLLLTVALLSLAVLIVWLGNLTVRRKREDGKIPPWSFVFFVPLIVLLAWGLAGFGSMFVI